MDETVQFETIRGTTRGNELTEQVSMTNASDVVRNVEKSGITKISLQAETKSNQHDFVHEATTDHVLACPNEDEKQVGYNGKIKSNIICSTKYTVTLRSLPLYTLHNRWRTRCINSNDKCKQWRQHKIGTKHFKFCNRC